MYPPKERLFNPCPNVRIVVQVHYKDGSDLEDIEAFMVGAQAFADEWGKLVLGKQQGRMITASEPRPCNGCGEGMNGASKAP